MNIVVLRRRLFYICAMVLLLIPLYFLGNPSVRNQDGSVNRPGGTLSQLRTQYNLGQGDLGEIDPASESMRLATLGLRGVAATILWQKAEYYKKEQYWDRLSATLNQIAVLQPHFVKVWEFQSHNLSYNVSAEFDNYRHRYQWVKRGMDYLVMGSKYNKHRSEMPYELGWFFGNKFGVSDEKKQFRELYRDDADFHRELLDKTSLDLTQPEGLGPDRKPDNWLSGRLWYERSYDMVASGSRPARSSMMFYRMGPQWLMKYSEGVQGDGYLDDAARYAWRTAGREWRKFGERQIVTTFGDTIYLTELQVANEEYVKAKEDFETLCGDAYQKIYQEQKEKLTPEQLAAFDKEAKDRTFQEVLMAEQVESAMDISPQLVAKSTTGEVRIEAMQAANDLQAKREKINHIEIYRNQINYPYWEERCAAEQEDAALAARTNMYDADQLLEKGELDEALEKYEVAWDNWEDLFNRYPGMMIDDAADAVLASIEQYRRLLDSPELPEDFGLAQFMEFRRVYDDDLADPAMMSVISSWTAKYPGRNFLDEMLNKVKDSPAEDAATETVGAEPSQPSDPSADEPGVAIVPKMILDTDASPTPSQAPPSEVAIEVKEESAVPPPVVQPAPPASVISPAAGTPPKTESAEPVKSGDDSEASAEKKLDDSELSNKPDATNEPSEASSPETELKVSNPGEGTAPSPGAKKE